MNASFGIDHPLLATHDIEGLRDRLISLGFNMTSIGKHPWGTSTSLAMFDGCLLEIMGIYDDTLIDEVPAGDFRFGRHVFDHLQVREGVALSALHSTDMIADATTAKAVGFDVAGHLEFGRDVVLPDGSADRTKTTLALLPDPAFPRLSFFLCQQHRPELIYVPEWLEHPNSVNGIGGVTILAKEAAHVDLRQKLSGLYGEPKTINGGFQVQTANGPMAVQTLEAIESEFGELPQTISVAYEPSIVAMDLTYKCPKAFDQWIKESHHSFRTTNSGHLATNPNETANVFLRFVKV
ncbi:VOC family protein [Sedimentitalea sp. CY04]|uniref:VOC family protein n=1 Tax=Parasedimentitalea denitrificans TaxID=2211118 RepID=A0ABX0W7U0_9RHOB|nr:VOC family protein [Sedimentitalea sp. CY04]NIZ61672.1 VOC family protein [Sedimentitalea sp. CY04]